MKDSKESILGSLDQMSLFCAVLLVSAGSANRMGLVAAVRLANSLSSDPRTEFRPLGAIAESADMNDYEFVPPSPIEEEQQVGSVYGRPGSTLEDAAPVETKAVQEALSPRHALSSSDLVRRPDATVRGDEWTKEGAAVTERGSQITSIGVGSGRPESVKKEAQSSLGVRHSSITLPPSLLTMQQLAPPPYSPARGIQFAGTPGSGLQERQQGDEPILPKAGFVSRQGDPVSADSAGSAWVESVKPQKTASAPLHLSSLRGVYPKWSSAAGAPPIRINPPRNNEISGPESNQKFAGTGQAETTTILTATTTKR